MKTQLAPKLYYFPQKNKQHKYIYIYIYIYLLYTIELLIESVRNSITMRGSRDDTWPTDP